MRHCPFNGQLHFNGKVTSQTGFTFFVIFDGLNELSLRLRVERRFHAENLFQILRNTSSPGTATTFPVRSSSRRLLATAAHSVSITVSGGLRFFRSESTTLALSSTGREIASAIKSAVFIIYLKFRHSRLLPAGISAVASDDHNADGIPQR